MVARRSTLNSAAPWPALAEAQVRVLDHQRKLHRWSKDEPARRFDDLFNLVCDRATLVVAWERVAHNRGARTAGVDAVTRAVAERRGIEPFLEDLRSSLRDGSFRALPVKQAAIPKRGGKVRYLGIPTLRDRVAQMALKLVLEPIFEADSSRAPTDFGRDAERRTRSPRSSTSPSAPMSGSWRATSRRALTASTMWP
jgi:RNA-directed DNA polymerase